MVKHSGEGFGRRGVMELVCGAMLLGGVRGAEGSIYLKVEQTNLEPALASAGWMGIELTFVATARGETVASWDLKNNFDMAQHLGVPPHYVFAPGKTIGISGPIHQAWTKSGTKPPRATPSSEFLYEDLDSYFLPLSLYGNAPAEDSNLISGGSVGDFGASPLVNGFNSDYGITFNYGVGSLMTESGAIFGDVQFSEGLVADVIVPVGLGNVHFVGVALNYDLQVTAFDTILNPAGFGTSSGALILQGTAVPGVPEAGTIGMLGLGVAMGVRRRRRGV